MSILKEIPQWVVDYNNKNYQSSAGKALRIVMDKATRSEEEWEALIELAKMVNDGNKWIFDMMTDKHKYTILKLLAMLAERSKVTN